MKRLFSPKNLPWLLFSLTLFFGVVIAEIPEQRYLRVLIVGAVLLAYFLGGMDALCFCINRENREKEKV